MLLKPCNGFITQALGGSFTIYVEGNLFRIAGRDADAIGKDPVPPPEVPENASDEDIEAVIWDQLKTCYDPEIPVNIVDLGLVYHCEVTPLGNGERSVSVDMTLTAPGCPVAGEMPGWVADAIEPLPGVKTVDVELTWDPPWGMDMMSDEARLELGFM